jgi:ABC-2 type transport system ATP-binding protein
LNPARPQSPLFFDGAHKDDMTNDTLVEVAHLSRHFGPIEAVRDVSFRLRRGEVLGFLGPNGAGKTTTMQMLTGNLAPSGGRVTIAGHDLLEDPRAAKSALGYLPEQPPLYRELTVDEYLDYCAALNRVARAQRRAARDSAKEKCGLTDVGRRLIGNLSKGYQQRVGLAQAIIHMPPLVILDEPTVGLDPIQIREIRTLIRDLGRDHSVLLSTHILPEVQTVCDRVLIIHKGRLVLDEAIGGLERHMRSAALTVAFHRPPAPGVLEAIAGVSAVHHERDGRLRVEHDSAHNPTGEIVRLATENDWGLHEIRPGRLSLEQLFVELTSQEKVA